MKVLTVAAALLAGLLGGAAGTGADLAHQAGEDHRALPGGAGHRRRRARCSPSSSTKALGQQVYRRQQAGRRRQHRHGEAAAHAPADGYTLLMGTVATQTMNEFLYPSVGYDSQKDFEPIILVGMLPMVISANPSFAANSVAELVAAAKAKPDKIDIALPSTTARLVFELLKDRSRRAAVRRALQGLGDGDDRK